MARARRRIEEFFLYEDEATRGSLGWRVTRRISREAGERMLVAGHAVQVHDEHGNMVGYHKVDAPLARNGVGANPMPVVLTAREMDLIAGQFFRHGRSKTAGMSEAQRLSRIDPMTRRLLPPEDGIERALARLESYAPKLSA